MRILSQDGTIDMPYELVALSVSYKIAGANIDKNVFCVNAHSGSLNAKRIIMGEYSSEEKAKKVFEMLRNVYYESEQVRVYKDGVSYLTTHFQFPTDDEIEV